jgi:multiple sugar transport system substrate-binding protein
MAENLDEWFAKEELVDPNYDIDDFVPAILTAYGKYQTGFTPDPEILWSVPYKFDVYLAFYRTDLFEEAGIVDEEGNAKPPETWAELLEDAKILQEKFPDITPVAIPLIVDDPTVSTFLPIFVAYGGNSPMPWFDENLYPDFHRPEAVEAVEALAALTPYMPTDALDMDYDKVNAFMAQGEAAYGLNWNAYLPVLLDPEKSKIYDTVGFDLVPGGPAGRPQGLGGWQMGISTDSKNKEAAFQLLQYLTGKDRAVKLALEGGSVARYSVAENPEIIEAFPYYPLLLEAVENVAVRGMDRSWLEQQMTIATAVNEILLGADAGEALLKAAQQAYTQAQSAGYTPEDTGPMPEELLEAKSAME